MTVRRCAVRAALTAPCAIALAALALSAAACSSSSVISGTADVGNPVPSKDFVGSWSSAEMMIDGAWNGTTSTFEVTPGLLGGGIVVAQGASGLTAQVVGNSGSSSPAFPAKVVVDTLSFSVPDVSGARVWHLQIPDPAANRALLTVGADTSKTWDIAQVPTVPTGQ